MAIRVEPEDRTTMIEMVGDATVKWVSRMAGEYLGLWDLERTHAAQWKMNGSGTMAQLGDDFMEEWTCDALRSKGITEIVFCKRQEGDAEEGGKGRGGGSGTAEIPPPFSKASAMARSGEREEGRVTKKSPKEETKTKNKEEEGSPGGEGSSSGGGSDG